MRMCGVNKAGIVATTLQASSFCCTLENGFPVDCSPNLARSATTAVDFSDVNRKVCKKKYSRLFFILAYWLPALPQCVFKEKSKYRPSLGVAFSCAHLLSVFFCHFAFLCGAC